MLNQLKVFFILFIIIQATVANAQTRGSWKAYMPFLQLNEIAFLNDEIICASKAGMFLYNTENNAITTFTKTTGLSEINLETVAKIGDNDIIIAYDNLNIDIIENGIVKNVPAIKNSNIVGEKKIFKILPAGPVAYICGTFGIAVMDLENKVILETYTLTDGSEQVFIYDLLIEDEIIMAATNKGIFTADVNNPNLFNVDEWQLQNEEVNLPPGDVLQLLYYDNNYFALVNNQIVRFDNNDQNWQNFYMVDTIWNIRSFTINNDILYTTERKLNGNAVQQSKLVITENGISNDFTSQSINNPDNILIKDNTIYIADNFLGLLKIVDGAVQVILPNGPRSVFVFDMDIDDNGVLWVASGSAEPNYSEPIGNQLGFYRYDGIKWTNYDRYVFNNDSMQDFVSVSANAELDVAYFGTLIHGLHSFQPSKYSIFNDQNSTLEKSDIGWIRIFDTSFDPNGNLWVINSDVNNLIKMRSREGDWYSFTPSSPLEGRYPAALATSRGQVWIVHLRNGILVYDYGNDIYSSADDQYKKLNVGDNNGSLPDSEVFSIAEDKDGEIWVGTAKGISIFFCAQNVFEDGCDGFEPIVDINGILGPLLQDDVINDIEVDDANRKWIATGNGAWLLSDDGGEVILNFTVNNSPLLSNNILDIEINRNTGEVFFGTDKGIISYFGDATRGREDFSNVEIYPNPVKPGYNGLITISNLVDNCNVKITDISGTLVHETRSLGGQLHWNGMDYTGRKVQSGVYLIFANTGFDGEAYEGKLMILH